MTNILETLKLLSEGNKRLNISILVVLSCFCTNTLYFFVVFREVFIEIEFLKLIILIASTGVTSFMIIMLGMFFSFLISFSISKKDADPYNEMLLVPSLYNFAYYLILLLNYEKDLMTIMYLLICLCIANLIVFGVARGLINKYKQNKLEKNKSLRFPKVK